MLGEYAIFIVPAYLVSAAVILALVVWPLVIYRRRRDEIIRLERQGVRPRSHGKPDERQR